MRNEMTEFVFLRTCGSFASKYFMADSAVSQQAPSWRFFDYVSQGLGHCVGPKTLLLPFLFVLDIEFKQLDNIGAFQYLNENSGNFDVMPVYISGYSFMMGFWL